MTILPYIVPISTTSESQQPLSREFSGSPGCLKTSQATNGLTWVGTHDLQGFRDGMHKEGSMQREIVIPGGVRHWAEVKSREPK
jgi:hypothetical protein